jgi:hypothetical protein
VSNCRIHFLESRRRFSPALEQTFERLYRPIYRDDHESSFFEFYEVETNSWAKMESIPNSLRDRDASLRVNLRQVAPVSRIGIIGMKLHSPRPRDLSPVYFGVSTVGELTTTPTTIPDGSAFVWYTRSVAFTKSAGLA